MCNTYVINKKPYKFNKIAAFDLDDTIMSKRSAIGRKLMVGRLKKFKELESEGYLIVIITNQLKKSIGDKKLFEMLEHLAKQIEDVILLVYVARAEDNYRKPATGIADKICMQLGQLPKIYVGDAAGRRGDFSDSDKQFAEVAGIPFQVPEKYFS